MSADTPRPAAPTAGGRPGKGGAAGAGGPGGPGAGPGAGPGGHGPRFGPVDKPADFRGSLARLLAFMSPEFSRIATAAVLAVVAVGTSVAGPYVMAKATNHIADAVSARLRGDTAGGVIDLRYVGATLGALIGLYVVGWMFNLLQQRITVATSQSVVHRMRETVVAKLDRLPLRYFDDHTHGEVLARITIDIDMVSGNLQQMVSQVLTSLVTLVGIAVMMVLISPWLALVAILVVPLTGLVTALVAPRSQKHFVAQQQHFGTINGLIEENFGAHAVVRAFGREEPSIREFDRQNGTLYDSAWRATFISGTMMPAVQFIGNLGYIGVVVVAAFQAAMGAIGIGDILAFIQYLQQFNQPLMMVAQISALIQGTIAAAERVFRLLDEPEEADLNPVGLVASCEPIGSSLAGGEAPALTAAAKRDGATPAQIAARGHVDLRCVNFEYTPGTPMIRDLTIEALPGQTVAIVGPTGAGKTTVVNLLMRFYDIAGGTITIDGENTASMVRADVRRHFGMVLQDTWLFAGTIRDNIAYGRDGATDDEIVEAARIALADHFIRTLPQGYDTVLNEDASNISVGQRQLLTIARAVLADAPILILDEATSSVDTRTERLIQTAMARLREGRTSFVIAHRLSTIRDADLILVMDRGHVVESGTHDQLIKACGFYADLYNAQFADDEPVCGVA